MIKGMRTYCPTRRLKLLAETLHHGPDAIKTKALSCMINTGQEGERVSRVSRLSQRHVIRDAHTYPHPSGIR